MSIKERKAKRYSPWKESIYLIYNKEKVMLSMSKKVVIIHAGPRKREDMKKSSRSNA